MRLDLYQQIDILFSVLEELLKSPFNKQFDDKVKHVLCKHGLDVVEGEIVKTQRRVSAEAKETGYGESDEFGEYINELSKQFPEVSFAKLSRIAVRVKNWLEQKSK